MSEEKNNIIGRQPVVVIMGHVDHGKSSLLEAIREGFVICAKESGGITQHIGAYEAEFNNKKITFIDTPGHEAFSAMRERGANVADIAILVVDSAEGPKPQTKEALNFIRKAAIPFIVAFSKIDKPEADPEKVKRDLAQENVLVESYGGKVLSCEVSAKTKQGIKELLETILLVAEMEELKPDLTAPVQGVVIESAMDSQKGPLATLLVTKGILQEGNIVATNRALGNLRNLADFQGKPLKAAGPGEPVLVLGFEEPPAVGEIFQVFANRAAAQEQIKGPRECLKQLRIESSNCVKILNIILKTDVLGSCEAIIGILKNIPHDKVVLRFLKTEVGDINASDVLLAEQTSAKIFGFRVKIDEKTNVLARQREVKIKIFDIIYELSQEARKAMTAVLSPETKRKDLAKFKTMIIFKQDKDEQIIGGRVLDGELVRNVKAEIIRDEAVIGIGRIRGLQKDKKDIGKAEKGQEVGILFQSEFPAQENDILVAFSEEKEKATL
ncbi:translation initiation factor IF-2 [bacterium (Candidatus Gribaldobacteria) CG08_land_8_20_14_0_20_39_15]|uniref:Translation initiation factor IF-2 n=1 Tax=bacterium (Candidatus Gribaldobacteria) CG08_land_8_20_14_0_20_39_15 TaxID=2014273 RepID=A0A2M6XTS6_9BACT|nr:MAG: translation initiation factor IF-2 [bacterium (Candidatus Gribaldobacteria) CG08_land_8_20_14_0_20_39_15]